MFLRALIPACVAAAAICGCGVVDEVTPRTYVGLAVGHSGALKIEIAKAVLENPAGPVPQAGAFILQPPAGVGALKVDFAWITRSGTIVIQSKEHAVTVLQEPIVANGAVTWTCTVYPAEAKPNLCGTQ